MKIKFYVQNCDSSLFTCFIVDRDSEINSYLLHKRSSKTLKASRDFYVNPFMFHLFLNELNCCPTYHQNVARFIKSSNIPFVIKLQPCSKEYLDKTWGEIVRVLIWEQLEIDHMMSWLSTLGGAFSALGDYFDDRSEIAQKISMQQMKLAIRLEDPALISRCLLYLSISMIQQHSFKLAKRIIRSQYEFALQHEDERLRKMCLGIWSKLQYTYKITRANRKSVENSK